MDTPLFPEPSYHSPSIHSSSATSDYDNTPPRQQSSRSQQTQQQRVPQPPRLASPRLFRDFFSTRAEVATQRRAHLPGPSANHLQDALLDVSRQIQSVNRAIQHAQEAFEGAPMNSNSEVVDLTGSPPHPSSESRFLSHTTHPHDSSSRQPRPINTFHEPVYGHHPTYDHEEAPDTADSLFRARVGRIAAAVQNRTARVMAMPRPDYDLETRVQEEVAVRRQRENHATWLRNQRRQQQQPQQPGQTSSTISSASPQPRQNPMPHARSPSSRSSSIEAVDLTAVEDNTSLAAALSKQRAEAVASQKSNDSGTDAGRTTLTSYKCPICMETPVNATSTICGHLFCHRCIIDTLKWSADQRREEMPHPRRVVLGVCPVCRKALNSIDVPGGKTRNLVPLEIKLVTRKRKRDDKGKGKAQQKIEVEDDDVKVVDGSEKENKRAGKTQKRESTEDWMWAEYTVA